MRRLLVLAAIVLVPASVAYAKAGPIDLRLCGANGCVTLEQDVSDRTFVFGARQPTAPVGTAPFYALHWSEGIDTRTAYWIPSAHVLRWLDDGGAAWTRAGSTTTEALTSASQSLKPYAPPKLEHVFVGDRVARAPQTYVRLFGGGHVVHTWIASAWIWVEYTSDAASPWTRDYELRVARTGPYVWRDWTIFRVSRRLARRARLGLPLR